MSNRTSALRTFAIVLVSVLISVAVAHLVSTRASTVRAPEQRVDTIIKQGEIRAGYYVGAPYFLKDPNTGKVSGIFADAFTEACANLGLTVKWTEEVGFGQMIEGLDSNRFDVVASGIWVNASRAKGADFTDPLLYDAVCAYVRSDDHRFDNDLLAIDQPSIRISTIDGEMASLIAKTDFPRAAVVSLPQTTDFTQMILNLTSNKADVTFLGVAAANKFLAANPGSIRNITPSRPLRVFPTAIMVKQGEYRLVRMLNLALIEMHNNGRIEAIIRRYEEHPGSHYRVAPGYTH